MLPSLFCSRRSRPESDFVDQSRAARLLKSIDLAPLRLRRLRIALLAASTLEHFAPVLRLWLARMGFDAEVSVNPFDTATQAMLDPASPLRTARPDIVWLFSTHRDIPLEAQPGDAAAKVAAQVDQAIAARQALWTTLIEQVGCTVIDNIVDCPADDPFGNLAGSAVWGRRAMLRRYNAELPAAAPAGVVLFDLDQVARTLGRARWEDARFWYHSRHAFALDASGPVAHAAARLIAGARGLAKKCLVLDLDNTLWGGVIGDDGVAGIALGHGEEGEAYRRAASLCEGAEGARHHPRGLQQERARDGRARSSASIPIACCGSRISPSSPPTGATRPTISATSPRR